ncbi:MAG: hypothetical protein CM1200mP22_06440 [Dehalococcoidia bacterium]|nr:MAG: hypothetical protein CM1200mP22_06440 [Dehalococcoidia bacterium]
MELAENGFFPGFPGTLAAYFAKSVGDGITPESDEQTMWPSTTEIFLPGRPTFQRGRDLVQKDLARSFKRLIEVEQRKNFQGP